MSWSRCPDLNACALQNEFPAERLCSRCSSRHPTILTGMNVALWALLLLRSVSISAISFRIFSSFPFSSSRSLLRRSFLAFWCMIKAAKDGQHYKLSTAYVHMAIFKFRSYSAFTNSFWKMVNITSYLTATCTCMLTWQSSKVVDPICSLKMWDWIKNNGMYTM